jgi:hypothetical protein
MTHQEMMDRVKQEKVMQEVTLYDTTLRDGTQAEDISFTVEDKLRIAKKVEVFITLKGAGRALIPKICVSSKRHKRFR